MNDVKLWIEERRGIHAKATPGEWWWEGESNEDWPQSENSLMAGEEAVVNGWGYDASGIDVEDDDATYITDALNMFPRALDAIEAVLKVHTPIEVNHAFKGRTNVCEQCSEDRLYALWPCETVEAIEGAIND